MEGETLMHSCPECDKRKEEEQKAEAAGLEIMVALMPLLTITFLSNLGLF